MSNAEHPSLERELAALTEPARESTAHWRAALDRHDAERASSSATKHLRFDLARWSGRRLVPLGIAAILVCAVSIGLWQSVSNWTVPHAQRDLAVGVDGRSSAQVAKPNQSSTSWHSSGDAPLRGGGVGGGGGMDASASRFGGFTDRSEPIDQSIRPRHDAQDVVQVGDRQVVRRVNMAIEVSDVRTAYQSVLHLVSEVNGEFVETSSLMTEQDHLRGELKIRVRADRLSAVLTDLRALGTVQVEQAAGDDVSEQMVDLEARLRNERRIETELLGLLESRNEAPLEDVLKLREQLNRVREQIERLEGQNAYLRQQVSLASIQISLNRKPKPGTAEDDQDSEDQGALFLEQIGSGWREGLTTLIRTLGATVRILIGGLMWWILIILTIWFVRRRLEQRIALT